MTEYLDVKHICQNFPLPNFVWELNPNSAGKIVAKSKSEFLDVEQGGDGYFIYHGTRLRELQIVALKLRVLLHCGHEFTEEEIKFLRCFESALEENKSSFPSYIIPAEVVMGVSTIFSRDSVKLALASLDFQELFFEGEENSLFIGYPPILSFQNAEGIRFLVYDRTTLYAMLQFAFGPTMKAEKYFENYRSFQESLFVCVSLGELMRVRDDFLSRCEETKEGTETFERYLIFLDKMKMLAEQQLFPILSVDFKLPNSFYNRVSVEFKDGIIHVYSFPSLEEVPPIKICSISLKTGEIESNYHISSVILFLSRLNLDTARVNFPKDCLERVQVILSYANGVRQVKANSYPLTDIIQALSLLKYEIRIYGKFRYVVFLTKKEEIGFFAKDLWELFDLKSQEVISQPVSMRSGNLFLVVDKNNEVIFVIMEPGFEEIIWIRKDLVDTLFPSK